MEIDGTTVETGAPSYFIAEAGVNHNGDVDLAEQLINVAANAGADAIKFQTFSADRIVTNDAEMANYQEETTGAKNQREMLRQYELDRAAHERLMDYCSEREITFLSTPFDIESVDLLSDLGVSAIKVGSGELDNHPLLEYIASLGLPMIVSTGMGTMEEVEEAYEVIQSINPDIELAFLHCTSAYPADVEDVNLRAMQTMDEKLPVPVGYSDHTTLPETPSFAVSAGAQIIEKHFTLDQTLPGPDHMASLNPDQLSRAINLVQLADRAKGDRKKRPTEAEIANKTTVRKSLHTACRIQAGTKLKDTDIEILRPADGISPKHYRAVVGAEVTTDLEAGTPITPDDLEIEIKSEKDV